MWKNILRALILCSILLSIAKAQILIDREVKKPAITQIDTILQHLHRLKTSPTQITGQELADVGKCGLRLPLEVLSVLQFMTVQQRTLATVLFDPPLLQKDTVIGRFRIHYDTTGIDEPALLDTLGQRIPNSARAYVDSVGRYFNEVWHIEIDSLGYAAPPIYDVQNYYNVYVRNLGSGYYGVTWPFPEQPINPGQTPPRYTSYIEIHNDFRSFYSSGMQGLKVTAAHEFHHAIQIGSYGFWGNEEIYFLEITSTWMEDVAYDDVNDYYQYLQSPSGLPRGLFSTPQRSFNTSNGSIEYSRAIWGKYLEKRFSENPMRRTWEFIRQEKSLQALNDALHERGSTLREAYLEFSLWNYFTGARADTVDFYTEGRHYPPIRLRDSIVFRQPDSTFLDNVGTESLGSVYYRLYFNPQKTISGTAIVSKSNIDEAGNGQSERFQYILRSDNPEDGSFTRIQLGSNVFWTKVGGVRNASDWRAIHTTDTTVIKPVVVDIMVYPNPFYIPEQGWIRFELPEGADRDGVLYIFSSNLELIYSQELRTQSTPLRSPFFMWNGQTSNNQHAASGVYVYVIDTDGKQYTGKFTVLRK